ncbi:MAG: alkaline phosphatase [Candidatus Synechococcus spongiarum 142]|uniref:Alkaline phosphatase n=1 Tax=Candidatus Synechococcus spongiarum 142 TaxID=1608213 RepID=A0A6N3X4K8_9SYNE|nr:MAG: alkaline phosphatase [Candidatus Synechococcus spongiarum 142]
MDPGALLTALPRLIGDAVAASPLLGYGAIFTAMLLENIVPPIPSEVIMPLGGFYVQQGMLQLIPVVLAGVLGTVVGALPWYGLGRLINEQRLEAWLQRHGRWLGISVDELRRTRTWFARHGSTVVFWGRLVPGIRTLISVPAGVELMPLLPFLLWTTMGSFLWILLLTMAGMALGTGYEQVETWLEPVSAAAKVLLVLILLGLAVFVGLRMLRRARSPHL